MEISSYIIICFVFPTLLLHLQCVLLQMILLVLAVVVVAAAGVMN